ncbi:MAG: outer membrane protein assembly factor BamD [Planctomycetota bacterium]
MKININIKIFFSIFISAVLCSCGSTVTSIVTEPIWRAGIFDSSADEVVDKYTDVAKEINATLQSDKAEEYIWDILRNDKLLEVKLFPCGDGLLVTTSYKLPSDLNDLPEAEEIEFSQKQLDTGLRQGQFSVEEYLVSTRNLQQKKMNLMEKQYWLEENLLRDFWGYLCYKVKPSEASRLFAEAENALELGKQKKAFNKYFLILSDYPGSIHENVALERCFEIVADRINSSWGVEKADSLLKKYACVSNADKLRFMIAASYYEWEYYDDAVLHFERVAKDYHESPLAPAAIFFAGRAKFNQYQGYNYEALPLIEAKNYFEKCISFFPSSDKAKESIEWLRKTKEKLAYRDWKRAQFYIRHDKKGAAVVYLESIMQNYPETEFAQKAINLIAELKK